MKTKIWTTGLLTLTAFSALLFWPRHLCLIGLEAVGVARYRPLTWNFQSIPQLEMTFGTTLPAASTQPAVEFGIRANGYWPLSTESDLKIINDLAGERSGPQFGLPASSSYWGDNDHARMIYFDDRQRMYVDCSFEKVLAEGKRLWVKTVRGYVGPQGMSSAADGKIGHFVDPICSIWGSEITPSQFVVYDRALSQFFVIDFDHMRFKTSSLIKRTGSDEIIQMGNLQKQGDELLGLFEKGLGQYFTIMNYWWPKDYILMLDRSGRISKFDLHTRSFAGEIAKIPGPADLLNYQVLPFTVKGQWRGFAVATVDHQKAITMTIHDEKGRLVASKQGNLRTGDNLSTMPFGSSFIIAKYLLEALSPPVLNVASIFAGSSDAIDEPPSGFFLMPNSFLATLHIPDSASTSEKIGDYGVALFYLLLPSFVLSIVLAFRVVGEATALGLVRRARQGWFYGTIMFGLVAYVTWRLVRPKEAMVTCRNCGKLRRPDFEKCQRCGGAWQVPELVPPAWRVVSPAEMTEDRSAEAVAAPVAK